MKKEQKQEKKKQINPIEDREAKEMTKCNVGWIMEQEKDGSEKTGEIQIKSLNLVLWFFLSHVIIFL